MFKLWGRTFIKLESNITIPEGYYGQIVGHSGLASTRVIIVQNETIDSDYCGIVYMVLFNLSDEECLVETGDCIAQLIIERCFTPEFVKVSEFTEEKADRGEKVLVLQVFDMSREQ